MTAKVILNPYAGRWSALERRTRAEAALDQAGIEYTLVVTEGPNQGKQLAMQAVRDGYEPIIAAGGDGSISEVINGLVAAAGDEPLKTFGVLPLGSANDLVSNLGLPKDLSAAAQVIASGHVRRMDLGQVNERYFCNNSGVGLEPTITLLQERIGYLKGAFRYLVAALQRIWSNPGWEMRLEWDDGAYEGPVTLVSVGNHPLTGGLFYMAPHADAFDGKLTFVYGHVPSSLELARLLPRAMRPGPGNHVEDPAIHEIHTRWLKITSNQATPLHADGEVFEKAIYQIEYRVLPNCLPILLPKSTAES